MIVECIDAPEGIFLVAGDISFKTDVGKDIEKHVACQHFYTFSYDYYREYERSHFPQKSVTSEERDVLYR